MNRMQSTAEKGSSSPPSSWRRYIKQKILKPGYCWVHRFAPAFADAIGMGICWVTGRYVGPFKQRFLFDVSCIARNDGGTGIQRVVNNLFEAIVESTSDTYAILDEGGRLMTSYAYMERRTGKQFHRAEESVFLQTGDILFLSDSSWAFCTDFLQIIREAKEKGVRVFAVIYDLFPIQYPETSPSPQFRQIFTEWHDMILAEADGIACISRTTADNVAAYFEEKGFNRETPLQLFFFPMGAEIECKKGLVRQQMMDFVRQRQTFLMVGTVEPRKGHQVVLQALATVAERHDIQLLILGHDGWKNDEIKKDMEHPALQGRVLWIQDAADHELHWAYQNTKALIAASKDEGYGLPLIEAAYFRLPILCSDIPIFHEVTQEHADFFIEGDVAGLIKEWESWLSRTKHPDSKSIRLYKWKEVAKEIKAILTGKRKAYKVLKK